MKYTVEPGLYAVGDAGSTSDVYVTANFKLSFDHLRRALDGMNAWILVLDTHGINVWCAAGKGTFGTEELVKRIRIHRLSEVVDHRRVIIPQLGAVGISAHEVKAGSGFQVVYGPVRASDIKAFVGSGNKASREMRTVRFTLIERVKLIPVELTYGKYYLILVPAVFFLLSGLSSNGYSIDAAWNVGGKAVLSLLCSYFAGCVLTPILLPLIPFKRFSLKGLVSGWLITTILLLLGLLGNRIIEIIAWYLITGAISSFIAMNFTGTSTFTSISGVKKEMKSAVPAQIVATAIGLILWIILRFV